MLSLIIILTSIPILKSLRSIDRNLSQLEQNTAELIVKLNKIDKFVELIKQLND